MPIVGLNFTKISGEKKNVGKKMNINTNTKIKKIEKAGDIGGKTLFKVLFEHSVKYEPGVGQLDFSGELLFLQEDIDLEKEWKKSKSIPKKYAEIILNNIFQRTVVESLIIAKELGLPAPIRLPRVKVEEDKSKKK